MAKSPNWLDVEHRPIENGAGDREIPAEGRIGWLSGKSRIISIIQHLDERIWHDTIFNGKKWNKEVAMTDQVITLGSVQETLLLPLWGRAVEAKKRKPLLNDSMAVEIVKNTNYDFSTISNKVSKLSQLSWIARSIYFDGEIRKFLGAHPDATIVNIGCGLDTTFDRVDNGQVDWYDLDMPDAISLRKEYMKESERRRFIPLSAFDSAWYSQIANKTNVLLLLAGVIYYFQEKDVAHFFKEAIRQFKSVDLLFDYCSKRGMQIANKKVIEDGGMDKKANLLWGLDDLHELMKWNIKLEIVNDMTMFKDHKKNYPIVNRIGMNISDKMKIMSLAHIQIAE